MQVDTETMEITMPAARMERLTTLLPEWEGKTSATKNEFQKLIGTMSWTCFGVRHGRTFLRRLIDVIKGVPFKQSMITLTHDILEEIRWWIRYKDFYSGISVIVDPTPVFFDRQSWSDASKVRCAGVWGDNWFLYDFTEADNLLIPKIHHKEMFAVVGTCKTTLDTLKGKTLLFHCDNMATFKAINNGRCKDPILMKLVRELFFLCSQGSFRVVCQHIKGKNNTVSDALSRPNLFHLAWKFQSSLSKTPTSFSRPTLDW